MDSCSSGTTSRATILKPHFSSAPATAGPETSARSPREEESLTVTTEAVKVGASADVSVIEEDILFLHLLPLAIATGLVQAAQAFHKQALRIEVSSLLFGLAGEIDLEIPASPTQNFEHGLVASQRTIRGMNDLAFGKIQLAFLAFVSHGEQATLAAHLERLHQVDHVHLREAAT